MPSEMPRNRVQPKDSSSFVPKIKMTRKQQDQAKQEEPVKLIVSTQVETTLVQYYLNHIKMSQTDSGLINLPKLWQKLPGVDTVWSKDRRASKMYERWKKSAQGRQAEKDGLIANTSDVAVCLIMPLLRKLHMDQPIVEFGERALLSLQQAQSGSQVKQTNHQLLQSSSTIVQVAVELQSDTNASKANVGNCATEPCDPVSDSSQAKSSVPIASKPSLGVHGHLQQLASSSASMSNSLKSQKLIANILDYMADASEMNDAIWKVELTLGNLPSVLPLNEFENMMEQGLCIGQQSELLCKDINRQFGDISGEVLSTVQGIVACVMKAIHLPIYTQEIGLLCCVLSLMYKPAVVADLVSRLVRATGLWNIPQLKADCRVLENMIAELPGYEKTAKFRSDWFAQSYVASWMASCYYKNPQSIIAKLPIWSTICYAADPRRAFLAVSVLHALSELPDMDQDQLMRAVQVKPGNLVTCEQLESPLYCLALKMCMDAVFPQQSYAGDILQNLKRAHTSSFRLDSLKQQIVQIESTSLPTQDMSKCAKCGEIKVAECMTCNCSFCNVHSADHAAHATTLEESDPGSDSMSSGDTHDSNI